MYRSKQKKKKKKKNCVALTRNESEIKLRNKQRKDDTLQ